MPGMLHWAIEEWVCLLRTPLASDSLKFINRPDPVLLSNGWGGLTECMYDVKLTKGY